MGGTPLLISEKAMDLKDKLKIFQRIRNTKHVGSDLQLLKDKQPSYPYIPRFERDPIRYAYDIQYALLDVASEEEITKNRTTAEGSSKTSTKKKTSSKTSTKKKTSSKTSTKKKVEENVAGIPKEKEETTDDGSSKTLTDGETSAEPSSDAEPPKKK